MTISIERVSHVQMDVGYGTWTPELRFGDVSTGITYTQRAGIYVKHGRLVTGKGYLLLSSKGAATGSATIAGLPYAAIVFSSPDVYQAAGVCPVYSGMTGITGYTNAPLGLRTLGSALQIYGYAADNSAQLNNGNFTDTSRIWLEFSYVAAE